MTERILDWDGLLNARDLAGLAVADGVIEAGRLVRSASPHTLTAKGWEALTSHGVCSTLDVRHDWEVEKTSKLAVGERPTHVAPLHYSLEPKGFIDRFVEADEVWKINTPLYYADFVSASPERLRAVLETIADAPQGGVLLHCYAGRDRAGLVVAVLLDLLGADHSTIIADHWLSFDRDKTMEADLGLPINTGELLPLSEANHHEIMTDFLA